MRDKIGGFLALFLLLFTNLAFSQDTSDPGTISPGDAFSGNADYEGYTGVAIALPIAIPHPKDVTPVPPVSNQGKEYRIITIVISEQGEEQLVTSGAVNTLLNAEKRPGETRLQFQAKLPYGAKTSLRQYFLDQSNGKFKVAATVVDYEWDGSFTSSSTSDEDADDLSRISAYRDVSNRLGSLSKSFDAVLFIHSTIGSIGSFNYHVEAAGAGASEWEPELGTQQYQLPIQVYRANDKKLIIRDLCIATAYTLCKLPPLYPSPRYVFDGSVSANAIMSDINAGIMNMAGFCLMGGLVPSVAANVLYENQPPSINTYYKVKLGWVDQIVLDQTSKQRAGTQHEGRLAYYYKPDTAGNNATNRDEYFIMETRQNRNYEAGTIFEDDDQPAAEETRGIFNPDKQGDPKDSVNPAEGLVVYHVDEENYQPGDPPDNLFFIGVVDSTWGAPTSETLTYPRAVPEDRAPWRLAKDAAFREQELFLAEVGGEILDIDFDDITDLPILPYTVSSTNGGGAYDGDGFINPAGGYGWDDSNPAADKSYFLSEKDAIIEYFRFINASNPEAEYEELLEGLKGGQENDLRRYYLWYTAAYEYAERQGRPITQFGQLNVFGRYAPSGDYILADPDKQRNPGLYFDSEGKTSEDIIEAPDPGTGYINAERVFQPGGGYRGLYIGTVYEGSSTEDRTAVEFNYYEIIPKGGKPYRRLFNSDGTFTNEVIDDNGGFYNFTTKYKDLIHQKTEPALEFFDFTWKNGSSNLVEFFKPGIDWVPTSVGDTFTPVFSNISPVDETMTTEVSNYDYYFSPVPDHQMQAENGYLTKRFANGLGVALKPDTIDPLDPSYSAHKEKMYDRYTIDININYLDVPSSVKVGIWNKGGQTLPYEVKMQYTDYTTFLNGKETGNNKGLLADRADTLRFGLDLEEIRKKKAGEPFPWTVKFPFCNIEWVKKGGATNGRNGLAELFINLTIQSPPRIIAAADADFTKFILKPEMSVTNVTGLKGTMELTVPQYAQEAEESMWLFNAGGSMLRYKLLGDKSWFSDSPVTNLNESIEQWLPGYNFTTYRVSLLVKDLIEAGGKDKTLTGEIRVFSENLDVVGSAPLPGKHGPYGQNVQVRVAVQDSLPPTPSLRLLSDKARDELFGNFTSDFILDEDGVTQALGLAKESLEIASPFVYPVFKRVPDVTHYLVYVSTEKLPNGPVEKDLYSIIPSNEYNLTQEIFFPEADKEYYIWLKSVGINDKDLEAEVRKHDYYGFIRVTETDSSNIVRIVDNRQIFERLTWLTCVRGRSNETFNLEGSEGLYSFSQEDSLYEEHGAYPLHRTLDSGVIELAESLDLIENESNPNYTNIDKYYLQLKELNKLTQNISDTDPFDILDIYEDGNVVEKGEDEDDSSRFSNIPGGYEVKDNQLPVYMNRMGIIYQRTEESLAIEFKTYSEYAVRLGNSAISQKYMIEAVKSYDGSLSVVAPGAYLEWNEIMGTTFTSNSQVISALSNANITTGNVEEVLFDITALYNQHQQRQVQTSFGRDFEDYYTLTLTEWANFQNASITKWRDAKSKNIFLSEQFSNQCTVKRTELGPPVEVSASNNISNYVQVKWNYITPGQINEEYYVDKDNFEVWRSKNRGFSNAVRVDNDDITIVNVIPGETSDLNGFSYFTGYAPDDLYQLTYSFKDYTTKPYPEKYYYYVIMADDNGNRSEPSRKVNGGLAKDNSDLLPIVDNSDDSSGNLFDTSNGTVEVVSRTAGSDDMAVRMARPSTTRRRSGSSTITNSLYDASIVKYVDLSGIDKGEVIMSFDYKFEKATDKGYVTAVANGKEIFVAFAEKVGDGWHKTGYIDLSSFVGKMVKLEIGLVCDRLKPTQALWLDNLYIAGKRFSPCWELFSSPVTDSLSDVLNVDYSSETSIYSWNNSSNDYVKKSVKGFNTMAGKGYWIYVGEPMKDGGVKTSSSMGATVGTPLANTETGWNLLGPVNDLFLKDERDISTPNPKMDYLNDYPNLCTLKTYTNADGESFDRYELKAQVWEWDSNTSKYKPVKDKLEAGKAYWIFNM